MAERQVDQAAGLRRLFANGGTRIVTFVAGSHGVGKSTVIANLAASLAQKGKAVLILDENAEQTVSSCFGIAPQDDLLHVIDGEREFNDILVTAFPGVQILPAARAAKKLGNLSQPQQNALLKNFSMLEAFVDVILVDASQDYPLGFSPLGLAAHDTVIVMAATPGSITDAYALIKKVSLGYSHRKYRVVINGVRKPSESRAIFRNVSQVARSRGLAQVDFGGDVPRDDRLQQAARLGRPVGAIFPETIAAIACRKLAGDLLNWHMPDDESGGVEQFVRQLLHLSRHIRPLALHA